MGRSIETKNRLGLGIGGWEEMGRVTVNRNEVSFRGSENVLKLIVNILKTIVHFKLVKRMAYELYLNKDVKNRKAHTHPRTKKALFHRRPSVG